MDSSIDSDVDVLLSLETSGNSGLDNPRAQLFKDDLETEDTDNVEKEKVKITDNKAKAKLEKKKLVNDFEDIMKRMTPEMLAMLPSNELVNIHTSLNSAMVNVVMALKSKCPISPTSSQSSQEIP